MSPNSTWRHNSTRYLAHAFWHRKSRDVLCRACRAARHNTRVVTSATGATRTTRVQGCRHSSVDWGGHVHLTFSRSCSWDWCKSRTQKTKLAHACTTAASSFANHDATRTTHYRDVSWSGATSGIWAIQHICPTPMCLSTKSRSLPGSDLKDIITQPDEVISRQY